MSTKRVTATFDRTGSAKVRVNGKTVPFVVGFAADANGADGSTVTLAIDPASLAIDGHADVAISPESVEALLDLGFIGAREHEEKLAAIRNEATRAVTAQFGKEIEAVRSELQTLRADAEQAAADRDAQVEANAGLEQAVAELRREVIDLKNERDAAKAEADRLRDALEKEAA